jgi:hypothetical protein
MNTVNATEALVSQQSESSELLQNSFRQTYHEIAARHIVEVDVLERLKSNLAQLEDMHARLQFMMGEVSYLIKRN